MAEKDKARYERVLFFLYNTIVLKNELMKINLVQDMNAYKKAKIDSANAEDDDEDDDEDEDDD